MISTGTTTVVCPPRSSRSAPTHPAWLPLSPVSDELWHRQLTHFNQGRLEPALPTHSLRGALAEEMRWRVEEDDFLQRACQDVRRRAAEAPRDAAGFVAWFVALRQHGPGQNDPLFPWLAQDASRDQMR